MDEKYIVKSILEADSDITIISHADGISYFELFGSEYGIRYFPEKERTKFPAIVVRNYDKYDFPHIMTFELTINDDICRCICLYEDEKIVKYLYSYEEKIIETLRRLKALLQLTEREIETEFQKEFLHYWNGAAKAEVDVYLNRERCFQRLNLYQDKKEESYFRFVSSSIKLNNAKAYRHVANVEGFYVPIVDKFCAESVDIKSEFRLEAMLRMLIRLGIAQWLVANNLTILKAFFSSIGAMVSHIGNTTMTQASIGAGEAEIIENLGFATSLVFLILSVILSLIILVCGFFIIYTVYFRFLKIMVIVPLAAIAFSTLAGNRTVSATCVRYFKYFLSVVMEAVTMALAILICNAFISAGLPSFTGGYADWAQVLIYLCEITFTIALTVGACKGAQSLTGRALGL